MPRCAGYIGCLSCINEAGVTTLFNMGCGCDAATGENVLGRIRVEPKARPSSSRSGAGPSTREEIVELVERA